MPNIQIKNVPDEVHRVLRRRAGEAGQSMQEYLLARLTEETSKPTLEELFREIDSRSDSGTRISLDQVVGMIRADRASH
ncbi:MAG: hypothetical protein M3355_04525 [Actinomycetota bacterium]|nr:hypothetical protein [Actinomycetota bacterium]